MKILLINHYAGTPEMGMEFRPYYLAKLWTELGHEVTIIASSYSHLRKTNIETTQSLKSEIIDGIQYLWLKTPKYSSNGFDRVKNMLVFCKRLYFSAKKIAKEYSPDVVIASSTYPMDSMPAKKIAKHANAKFIFEIHDLWPLSPMELGGYSQNHPFIAFVQYFENFAYNHADSVVSILPKTIEHCVAHGLNPKKWNYIPNGIYLNDWETNVSLPPEHSNKLAQLKSEGNFIVAYTGNTGIANALYYLIDSLKYTADMKIAVAILGTGTELEKLKTYAQPNPNIHFFKNIDKTAVPSFLEKVDAVYIGLKKESLFRFGVSPNKIFDYLMSGKPVIQAIDAGNDIVGDAKAGVSIEPENSFAIAEAITKLANMSETERLAYGISGKKFVLQNHEYSVLAKKFIEVMEGTTASN